MVAISLLMAQMDLIAHVSVEPVGLNTFPNGCFILLKDGRIPTFLSIF